MRKLNPSDVHDDFNEAVHDLVEALGTVLDKVDDLPTQRLVAEATLLNAVVLWEGFLSDLFIACLNRDASRYQKQRLGELKAKLTLFSVSVKEHPNAEAVRQALDAEGRNLTFKSPEDLPQKAKLWLAPVYASRFQGLTPKRQAVLRAASAMRNFLAHRSVSSRNLLQDALADKDLADKFRRQKNEVHDLGKWLLAYPAGSTNRRIISYLARLLSIAKALAL